MELVFERKIGEVFEYKGFKLITVERPCRDCTNCFFYNRQECFEANTGYCSGRYREDGKDVSFKRLE